MTFKPGSARGVAGRGLRLKAPEQRLWLQFARLLAGVASVGVLVECLLLVAVVNRALNQLPPATSSALRDALLPGLGRGWPLTAAFSMVSVCALLLGVGVSIALALVAARRFAAPLEAAAESASRLIAGSLETRFPQLANASEIAGLLSNLNALAEWLERSERERAYANAAIAHELRTPVAALRARLAALQDGIFPVTEAELRKLSAQLETLARLTDDLQSLTLMTAAQISFESVPVKLSSLVRSVIDENEVMEPRLNLKINGDPSICGDPTRLRQLLTNLLRNAARHTPADGTVEVRLDTGQHWVSLSVSDSGEGVPADEMERIFEHFYRSDESRSRNSGGSGLGLAVVKSIAESHAGHASAKKSDLGGLEVRVRFPIL
jgi:two-component system, OmpR family, sensor histidine kinase BaeS